MLILNSGNFLESAPSIRVSAAIGFILQGYTGDDV